MILARLNSKFNIYCKIIVNNKMVKILIIDYKFYNKVVVYTYI